MRRSISPRVYRAWLRLAITLMLSAVSCIGPMCASAVANLVQNGDFSTGDLTGWSAMSVNISGHFGGPVTQVANQDLPLVLAGPSDIGFGAFFVSDLSFGAITQTLVTVPGQTYRVDYIVRVLTDNTVGIGGGFVTVFDGIAYIGADPVENLGFGQFVPLPPGSPIHTGFFATYRAGTYRESFLAAASSDQTPIEFAALSQGEFFVTDVSVNIPEPPTFFLLAAGLFGLWIRIGCERTMHRSLSRE